jgi:hypothetical protein
MSCGAEMPPEFKAAIQNNLCAACGGELMNDASLELLDELKEALERMPNDPEGVAGWLLSNYEMRKVGTGEPVTQFHGGNPHIPQQGYPQQGYPQQGYPQGNPNNPWAAQQQMLNGNDMSAKEAQLRANPQQASNKLQMFYKNAGIKEPKTRAHYAQIANQINNNEEAGPDYGQQPMNTPQGYPQQGYPQQGYPQQNMPMQPQQPQPMNPVLAQQMALANGGQPPQGYGMPNQMPYGNQGYGEDYSAYDQSGYVAESEDPAFTQAALSAMQGTERPISREEMRAMQQNMRNGGGGYDMGDDGGVQNPALQMQRMDRLRKQQELEYGGSVGKITRSS